MITGVRCYRHIAEICWKDIEPLRFYHISMEGEIIS